MQRDDGNRESQPASARPVLGEKPDGERPGGHGSGGQGSGGPRFDPLSMALLAVPMLMIAGGLALVLPGLVRVAETGAATAQRMMEPQAATRPALPPKSAGAEPVRTAGAKPAVPPAASSTAGVPAPVVPATAEPASPGGGLSRAEAMRVATPATPWLAVAADKTLTRIGVGSCLDQRYPQPIWTGILKREPELFLMIGDNVYGDIKNPDGRELATAYGKQLQHPEFREARARLPMVGIWDDHDYGLNDGGGDYAHRELAADLFKAYWQMTEGQGRGGVYHSRIVGPEGRRVQIIMLDTRSFRSPLGPKPRGSPLAGKYGDDGDRTRTMLGSAQWAWLEGELRKPADIRLVVSSIQVLSEGHAFERWGHMAHERDRLVGLIASTGAKGVVLLSGDRHLGAIYNRPLAGGQILVELTSSSLNRSYGGAKDVRTPELLTELHHVENFGLVGIDWNGRKVRLALNGMGGEELDAVEVRFRDLGLGG